MQNKNKNNCTVTKLPTAKLIEIDVANCKNGRNLEISSCTSYESRSYKSISRYLQSKAKENFSDFCYKFIEKQMVKVEEFQTNYWCNFMPMSDHGALHT